jgi:hypothetical protein
LLLRPLVPGPRRRDRQAHREQQRNRQVAGQQVAVRRREEPELCEQRERAGADHDHAGQAPLAVATLEQDRPQAGEQQQEGPRRLAEAAADENEAEEAEPGGRDQAGPLQRPGVPLGHVEAEAPGDPAGHVEDATDHERRQRGGHGVVAVEAVPGPERQRDRRGGAGAQQQRHAVA